MLFLLYLLKVSACIAVFYALYLLVFRRFTFHTLNRFYLLSILCLSFIIPLISFETTKVIHLAPVVTIENPSGPIAAKGLSASSSIDNSTTLAQIKTLSENPDWTSYLLPVYCTVALILTGIFLTKLFRIFSLSRQAVKTGRLRILQSPETIANASFFNIIFLNTNGLSDKDKAKIIAHESAHFHKLHSVDMLLAELGKIVLWFNPLVYFYQKSLVEIHEFEADHCMAEQFDTKEYAHLLLKLSISYQSDLTNLFSLHPLSTRIQFLFRKQTTKIKKLLYVLGLPLLAVGVFAFAQRHEKIVYEKKANKPLIRLASTPEKLIPLSNDSLVSKNNAVPLTSVILADTSIKPLYTLLHPFAVPEIKLPDFTIAQSIARFSTSEIKVMIRIPMTPERYSLDFFNDGKLITSDVPDNDIKIFQAEKELIPGQDFDLVMDDGVVRDVFFKAHVQSETVGVTIQFKKIPGSLPNVYPSINSSHKFWSNMTQQIPYTPDPLRTRLPSGTSFMKDPMIRNHAIFRKKQ